MKNSGQAALAAFSLRLLTSAVVMAFTSTLFSLFIWTVLPLAAGWSPSVVMTGSMEPAIKPGDIVVTAPIEPSALQLGYVIRFRDPTNSHPHLLHRITKINKDGTLMTRGDANRSDDSTPVPTANVTGVARLRVPVIGLPAVWLRNGQYLQLGLTLLAVAAAAWSLAGFRALVAEVRTAAEPDPEQAATEPDPEQAATEPDPEQAATEPDPEQAATEPEDGHSGGQQLTDVQTAADAPIGATIGSADGSTARQQPVKAGDATAA